jgi:hypothetical protein
MHDGGGFPLRQATPNESSFPSQPARHPAVTPPLSLHARGPTSAVMASISTIDDMFSGRITEQRFFQLLFKANRWLALTPAASRCIPGNPTCRTENTQSMGERALNPPKIALLPSLPGLQAPWREEHQSPRITLLGLTILMQPTSSCVYRGSPAILSTMARPSMRSLG